MNEATVLNEAGVNYCRPRYGEEPIPGMIKYPYWGRSPEGIWYENFVYTHTYRDLTKLLDHWSRAGWLYQRNPDLIMWNI